MFLCHASVQAQQVTGHSGHSHFRLFFVDRFWGTGEVRYKHLLFGASKFAVPQLARWFSMTYGFGGDVFPFGFFSHLRGRERHFHFWGAAG